MLYPAFKDGQCYTRDQIRRRVGGGGLQDYLPNKGGRVLAGCFTTTRNPEAPAIVLPGLGPRIRKAATLLLKQRDAIPVFLKRSPNRWEYCGEWHAVRSATDGPTIRTHAVDVNDVSQVLFLKRKNG